MAATKRNKALREENEYVERIQANANRPEHEVTVSIIDSIHTLSYLLMDRDMTHPDVIEAVKDLVGNSIGYALINRAFVDTLKPANGGPGITL